MALLDYKNLKLNELSAKDPYRIKLGNLYVGYALTPIIQSLLHTESLYNTKLLCDNDFLYDAGSHQNLINICRKIVSKQAEIWHLLQMKRIELNNATSISEIDSIMNFTVDNEVEI